MYINMYVYIYIYFLYIHIDHLLKPTLVGISWGWLQTPNQPAGGKYHGKHPRVENPMKFAVLNCWHSNRNTNWCGKFCLQYHGDIFWDTVISPTQYVFLGTDLKMRYSHKTLTFYERKQ